MDRDIYSTTQLSHRYPTDTPQLLQSYRTIQISYYQQRKTWKVWGFVWFVFFPFCWYSLLSFIIRLSSSSILALNFSFDYASCGKLLAVELFGSEDPSIYGCRVIETMVAERLTFHDHVKLSMAMHVPWEAFHALSWTMKWQSCQKVFKCIDKW